MTNKLRSVIEEKINKWKDFFPADFRDDVPVIPYEDAKQAQLDLLDALIEEMEKDEKIFQKQLDYWEAEGMPTKETEGSVDYLWTIKSRLKQTREELSTI